MRYLTMSTGTVKWFNNKNGYGFITPDGGVKDVFVHISQVQKARIRQHHEGQQISYETYDDRGRTAAGNLKLFS